MATKTFGSIRSMFWPIHKDEVKTLLPMLGILFLLLFNHCVLWSMKDALVITTSGAEVIPFVKVWAVLPCAVLLTCLFTYLSNRYSHEAIFYSMTGGFLLLFGLFAFVLYPYRDLIHPFESAAYLESMLPAGFKGLIAMYRHWSYTGFYVICELWNTMIISVLFWGFANEVTKMSQAPRFYSVLSVAANAAVCVAGVTAASSIDVNNWENSMTQLVGLVIVCGGLAMALFRVAYRNKEPTSKKMEKEKLTFKESISYIAKSKYLISIAILVVAYNLVINSVEVVWKDQLRNLYPNIADYNSYVSKLQALQGIIAMVISLGVAVMIKRFGWIKTALVTPIVMLCLCALFFGTLLIQGSAIGIAVLFGSIQNCMSKACKTSLFDSTKEMAYIPLELDTKLKGKAAIDGVGARLGKSGGSIIHQGLLMLFATVSSSVPYIGFIVLIAIMLWIFAISRLAPDRRIDENEKVVKKLVQCNGK